MIGSAKMLNNGMLLRYYSKSRFRKIISKISWQNNLSKIIWQTIYHMSNSDSSQGMEYVVVIRDDLPF